MSEKSSGDLGHSCVQYWGILVFSISVNCIKVTLLKLMRTMALFASLTRQCFAMGDAVCIEGYLDVSLVSAH